MAEPPGNSRPYVFISYSSSDRDRALGLADRLEASGIRVWLDRHAIEGGESWSAAIVQGITDCTVFAVLCSQPAMGSENVRRELQLAMEERRPLLPLLLEQVEQPPEIRYALAGRQWIELLERPESDWLPDVLRALASFGLVPGVTEPATGTASATQERTVGYLPTPLTSLLGREQELAEITRLLQESRLLTLTGPGGTGKTWLALAAAKQVAAGYPDGAWLVDLSGVRDAADVIPAIAQVLDVRESEGRSLAVSLAAYLRRKRLLLVLDNFEQVVEAAMPVYDLLVEAPGLTLLVTSRVLLRVEGEREYAVPPLLLPEAGAGGVLGDLAASPAVQLFVERAQAHRADFRLSVENAAAVAAICRRLDGLPLAIELAAARVKLLSPTALLARLDQRLPLLTGGARSLPQRQQTLRAAIAWSWDLLSEPERLLFRRLAVFAGGWTLEAAEAVCNPNGGLDVLEGLDSLMDKSLVRQRELNGEPRFWMLATLQEFAREQLQASGEAEPLQRQHAEFYGALAEQAHVAYWRTGRARDLLRVLDPERDNLVAALQHVQTLGDAELGLRLAGAVASWSFFRGPGEGRRWTALMVQLPAAQQPSHAKGVALFESAICAIGQGESQAAVALLEEAVSVLRAIEDLPWLGTALCGLGVCVATTEPARALTLAEQGLALLRATGEPYMVALAELNAGWPLFHAGDFAAARLHFEQGLRLARELGADWLTFHSLGSLAWVARRQGNHEELRRLLLELRPLAEAFGNHFWLAMTAIDLGLVASAAGEYAEATAEFRQGLRSAGDVGSTPFTATCLAGLASVLTTYGQPQLAARVLAASERVWRDAEQYAYWRSYFDEAYEPALAATQARLSLDTCEQAWAEGQALSLDQAVAEVLRLTDEIAAGESGDAR